MSTYTFSKADSPADLLDIYRLNHRIFAEEIGQHELTETGLLIDRFDSTNVYFLARRGAVLAGMISVNEQPLSVAAKLANPAILASLGDRLLEVRLLAIEPAERRRRVLAGLFFSVFEYAIGRERTHLVISGIREQISMYESLGFRALGPEIMCGSAEFTPMALPVESLSGDRVSRFRRWATNSSR